MHISHLVVGVTLGVSTLYSQYTKDPFPTPIPRAEDAIRVNFAEFASIPFVGNNAPRMMLLLDEPQTRRLFVHIMSGPIYSVSYDGKTVREYVDVNAPVWGIQVHFSSHDSGFQSFAFHPQFDQPGTRGYGKFYTFTDTDSAGKPDFRPNGPGHAHDTVLLEWTAKNPKAETYDGGPPREVFRITKAFSIHNGGQIAFNPLAKPSSPDYGLLYIGVADGGNGGDPYKHAQNLTYAFGKILRIDPLGSNSANGKYGIPPENPFMQQQSNGKALGEIYAYGCRNPQRFSWDPKTGNMFMADIGQEVIEKVTLVRPGANLGWNIWEGSFTYAPNQVGTATPRDPNVTYPVVEFDHTDPLLQRSVAITGVVAYRAKTIPQLTNKLLFGDNPSGEIFYVDADNLPKGGQDAIRRVLLLENGIARTLLQVIREKNAAQDRVPATRADMRFNVSSDGRIFVLNKMDGVIRCLLP